MRNPSVILSCILIFKTTVTKKIDPRCHVGNHFLNFESTCMNVHVYYSSFEPHPCPVAAYLYFLLFEPEQDSNKLKFMLRMNCSCSHETCLI